MKSKNKKLIIGVVVAGLLCSPLFMLSIPKVEGLSRACQNSPECVAAAAREAEANKAAAAASSTASAYERKVKETTAEIAAKEAQIAESQAEIESLKKEIKETEEKIASAQDALEDLLIEMYYQADIEPIRVLAGATSISDLAEKTAREEVAQEQINYRAGKIKEDKEKLEEDKERVEAQIVVLKAAKEELAARRAEQQTLVAKYKDNAQAYEAVAAKAREEKQAAERKWQQEHASILGGAYYSGDNTYPWQADCPQKQDYYATYINGRKIGGYVCECVSYVGWKAYEAYGLYLGWGNAYSWDDGARAAGYRVNHTPAAGTIGQIDDGPYGHVFWVESVNANGSINVTEYNNSYATYLYSGRSRYGDFGARTISAGEAARYNYIHFK